MERLTKQGAILLYDLAIDDFVNIKHGTSLFYLMNKGLIVWDDKNNLQIFSEEFRNFHSHFRCTTGSNTI